MANVEQFPLLRFDESDNQYAVEDVLNMYDENYDQGIRNWGTYIEEADRDMAYYLGDQWDQRDKNSLAIQKRAALVFNKIHRIIKMIEGYERKTRVSLIASPVEPADEKLADQTTEMLLWQMNTSNIHMTNSDAFAGSLKTGINLVELFMDYNKDPLSGDIQATRIPHNSFMLDPRFERRDLKDCEWMIRRKYLSKEAVKAILPFREDDIELIPVGGRDEKFPNMPHSRDASGRQTLRYDEMWRRKYRDVTYAVDMETGEIRKWEGNQNSLKLFQDIYPTVKTFKRKEQYIELNVIVEREVMYTGENPWGVTEFPFIPVMAFWDPEYSSSSSLDNYSLKLQGIVRGLRDPQTEVNKRRSKALDIMDSGVHSGWKAKENSVSNPADLYKAGNNSVIWMKDDSQMTDAERLPPGDIPPSLVQLSELFDKDLMEIAGASSELFGMPENDNMPISGILAKVRQGAGLTILQDLFDNYRFSQKLIGERIIEMMQKNYHPSKVRNVINEEPIPEFYDTSKTRFNISVEEAIETPSQKNLFYMQLVQAKQMGIPIPDSLIIEYMPTQGKDKIIDALKQQEQQQAQIQQIETQQRQTINELSKAKIMSDVSLGIERISQAQSNQALARERIAQSQQDRADAMLKRAEAITKISQMNDDQILKWLEFVKNAEQESFNREEMQLSQDEKNVDQDINQARQFVTGQEGQNLMRQILQQQGAGNGSGVR